jgi:hypothetical protein
MLQQYFKSTKYMSRWIEEKNNKIPSSFYKQDGFVFKNRVITQAS